MIQTEVEAYNQMTREQQREYVKRLVRSYTAHKKNAAIAVTESQWTTATIHEENATADMMSLESLLSPVIFCDVCEEL